VHPDAAVRNSHRTWHTSTVSADGLVAVPIELLALSAVIIINSAPARLLWRAAAAAAAAVTQWPQVPPHGIFRNEVARRPQPLGRLGSGHHLHKDHTRVSPAVAHADGNQLMWAATGMVVVVVVVIACWLLPRLSAAMAIWRCQALTRATRASARPQDE
jgi:hypothetical protein